MNETCKSENFWAVLLVQMSGVFADSLFKIAASLYAVQVLAQPAAAARFMIVFGVLHVLPFIFFSPLAGYWADRYAKRAVIIRMSGVKAALTLAAAGSLVSGNLWIVAGVLFLFMSASALLSPAKIGLVPEIVSEDELSKANGYLQSASFSAMISGTALGGYLFTAGSANNFLIGAGMVVPVLFGFLISFFIKPSAGTAAARPEQEHLGWRAALRSIRGDAGLFLTMLALVFFSFLGTMFQMNILLYGRHVLAVGQVQSSFLLVAVFAGIGIGSILAGKASEGKVELGLVPLGAAGITALSFALGWAENFAAAVPLLLGLGICAGFYTVPLNAFFQRYSPAARRGAYLSVLNIAGALSALAGGVFLWVASGKWKLGAEVIFGIGGLMTALVAMYIVRKLPIALLRLVSWLFGHTVYKLRVVHRENVPESGGALLIANHISYVDALLILAALKRPVRFIMYRKIYEQPLIHVFCRLMRVIPIDREESPKAIARALMQARAAIAAGELVCIFPEGALTHTGNLLPFNRGFEHIMKGLDAPIVPLYLDNIWGSVYTYADGKYFWKFPRLTLYPVSLVCGKPLPATAKAFVVRRTVQELSAEANILRGAWRKKLHLAFIDEVKRHPFRFCMADSFGARFSYPQAFAAAVALSKRLFPAGRRPRETNEMVGILLPPSCFAALANLAVAFAGKVPVNLNYTLSSDALDDCVRQCSMRLMITSRAFCEKLNIAARPEMVYGEDIKARTNPAQIFLAFMAALFLPRQFLRVLFVRGDTINIDDVATVIFSSGSTGEPKGVMLTHANIFSNIEGFYQIFQVKRTDVVLAALPFFHSFGFTATLCFPLGTATGVVYHTNPLDAATIGSLARQYKATLLMGTPTFLSAYVKKCTTEQFATLRAVLVGAEKLKEPLARAFEEKFGIMPFEGYGATELSPIVTVGYPDYWDPRRGQRQVGHKAGTVGHPLPGVAAQVVDPDTGVPKEPGEAGLLLVKGANVMKGYLHHPEKTAEAVQDGWYRTGDIASIDDDGFITITDRMSRFSKIGGEMVPHSKIEEQILSLLGAAEPVVAVTAVADEQKGERLVVLHTAAIDSVAVCAGLKRTGLPNLWIPKPDSFFSVEAIPILGTGKVDLKRLKTLAEELAVSSEERGMPRADSGN
ncbi:MAG: MFS transporter [Candidatus Omnitrophica bacterium]|nr:MFS transporter [Candidatus Omnitrophota bacterium]